MKAILGISVFYHGSATVIIADETVVAAAQGESYSRNKHDALFPVHTINYALNETGLEPDSVIAIAFF